MKQITLMAVFLASCTLFPMVGCGGNSGAGDDVDAAMDVPVDGHEDTTLDDVTADSPVDAAPDPSVDPVEDDAPAPECPAAALGARLGVDHFLLGGSMRHEEFEQAPFQIGYRYVSGDVPDDGPCEDCRVDCTVRGSSCSNAVGCAWWGCWQWDEEPPGRYVANYLSYAHGRGAVPMITYYIVFSVAGDVEGGPELAALQDGSRVSKLLMDFRFLCQVMNEDPTITALLHVEPDLWGYGHQASDDPTTIPVDLAAAGAVECGGLGDHLAGLARCMLAIARAEAPNVLVGFHASAWGAGHDALSTDDPTLDLDAHADATAAYMAALGATEADFVVVEQSDRDAGFDDRWWDDTNTERPHFHQAIAWVQRLGHCMGLAPLWWQVPYGNMALTDNVCHTYQDNRVDYFFDHPEEFARGEALGIAFGAGEGCQTTPQYDDGHFLTRAGAYLEDPALPLCME